MIKVIIIIIVLNSERHIQSSLANNHQCGYNSDIGIVTHVQGRPRSQYAVNDEQKQCDDYMDRMRQVRTRGYSAIGLKGTIDRNSNNNNNKQTSQECKNNIDSENESTGDNDGNVQTAFLCHQCVAGTASSQPGHGLNDRDSSTTTAVNIARSASVNSSKKANYQFYTINNISFVLDILTAADRSNSFNNFINGNKSKQNVKIMTNGHMNGYQYHQLTSNNIK